MATRVKFLKHPKYDEVFAYFPQWNYNKRLYGNTCKVSYSHISQHSGCDVNYAKESKLVNEKDYKDLLAELTTEIGYDNLVVLNK